MHIVQPCQWTEYATLQIVPSQKSSSMPHTKRYSHTHGGTTSRDLCSSNAGAVVGVVADIIRFVSVLS